MKPTWTAIRRSLGTAPAPALVSGGRRPVGLAYRGDALETARRLPEGSVDLIYADPPFGTGRRKVSRGGSFEDPSGDAYTPWLRDHAVAFHRILSPRGVLFLHLDWRSAARARLLFDGVFGEERLVNEIIWAYRTGGVARRHLARKHDTILFYSKTASYTFRRLKERSYLRHEYGFSNVAIRKDERGRPFRETFLRDVWEIPALRGNQPEATGYPTQKPLALLERIFRLGSDRGDLVFDPFTGSGTAAVAAQRLGRRWIACDPSEEALRILGHRLALADAAGQAFGSEPP